MGVYVYQNEQLDKVAGLGYNVVDSTMSSSSENPVQNKVIKEYVDTNANAKVSKDQGVAQSGKVLGINVDGMVEPVDVAGSASDITYDNSTSGLSATNAQDAIDEIDATVDGQTAQISSLIADTGNAYKTTDTTDTTLADADYIPFSTSASAKKKITWANIITKIKTSLANYFGRKFSQSNGKLSLLAENNTVLDSVTLSPLATNTSYTDTNNIGATSVQSAVDFFGAYSEGQASINTTYLSGQVNWQKIGRVVSVALEVSIIANLPSTNWEVQLITGLPPVLCPMSWIRRWTLPSTDKTKSPLILAATATTTFPQTALYSWGNGSVTSGTPFSASFTYICK